MDLPLLNGALFAVACVLMIINYCLARRRRRVLEELQRQLELRRQLLAELARVVYEADNQGEKQ